MNESKEVFGGIKIVEQKYLPENTIIVSSDIYAEMQSKDPSEWKINPKCWAIIGGVNHE